MSKKLIVGAILLGAALVLAACSGGTTPAPTPSAAPTSAPPTAVPPTPAKPSEPAPAAIEIPFEAKWAGSGHADATAEAFNHWNEDDPKEIPVGCARCHSTYGYQDFLGADGSAAGTVDKPAAVGSTITCVACHNDATVKLSSVVFPSGAEITGLGPEARCLQCHQGRAAGSTVADKITAAAVADDDTVSDKIGFTNIHYFAAGATMYGTLAKGGFEYPGKAYDGRSQHVDGYSTCIECHDQHSLEVKVAECATCHTGVASKDDLKNIRMQGSLVDYDGDGNTTEGIYYEIEGLRGMLYQAIQAYAKDTAGAAIAYTPDANPYFFIDKNGNGQVDQDEAVSDNKYVAWTGRLAKAAYNYQVSVKDPGAFAHGGKYIIELLYDSIDDLNQKLATPIDLSKAHRIDAGHFAGSEMAFRDWDAEGVVPGRCTKCHQPGGLPQFLAEGTTISAPIANGLKCTTCHESMPDFKLREITSVTFPSGTKVDAGNPDTNLCISCHQGRESTTSVNAAIKGLDLDTVADKLTFRNVHYFAAGATLFGTEAKGAYEFADKQYNGRRVHVEGLNNCTDCHDQHTLTVKVDVCATCHAAQVKGPEDLEKIRMTPTDFDGDGNTTEGIAEEIGTMRDTLYASIQAYAKDVAGTPIAYSAEAYPYFFKDTNGNGVVDEDEAVSDNSFKAWTPRLLVAAYNYQYVQKDPGTFAHNPPYMIQVLYDTLESLSAKVTVANFDKMVRPEVKAP